MATILLPGTLDTKGEEYAFVRDLITARGHRALAMDLGIMGAPAFEPGISATEVAIAAGTTLEALRAGGDRGKAVDAMTAGARKLTRELHARGDIQGVLGLGGGGGTTMITAAMRAFQPSRAQASTIASMLEPRPEMRMTMRFMRRAV